VSEANRPPDQEAERQIQKCDQVIRRAQGGDASALPALREMLKQSVGLVDMLGGDLARQAEAALVVRAAGKNHALKEALYRKLDLLRAELSGPSPAPVERLLVERVVACWLQVHYADAIYSQGLENFSMEQAEHHQRRMDGAHRRYLSALRTLALVRKLALPVLQVNIARKQVNVAGPAPAE
jgi:hypothetical protein